MQIFEHIDKRVVIGFGIALVLILGVFFYSMGGSASVPPGPISMMAVSPLDATLGRDLLEALAKLDSTKLDTSIFSDPVFGSLKDFGVEISAQPVGRRNPFAEFAGSAASVKTTGTSSKTPASVPGVTKTEPKTTPKPFPAESEGFDIN